MADRLRHTVEGEARPTGVPGWVWAPGLLAGVLLLRIPSSWGPPCVLKWLTDFPCPGCGSTRALRALAHLDVPGALAWNPLLTLVAIGGLMGLALRVLQAFDPSAVRVVQGWWPRAWPALVGAVAINWAYLLWVGR